MFGKVSIAVVLGVLGLMGSGCSTAPDRAAVPNLHEVKRQMHAYAVSRRYENDLAAVIDQAKACLELRCRTNGRLAIVLDLDETLLSNIPWLEMNDWGVILRGATNSVSGPCGFLEWAQLARDQPIQPTLELARLARAHGVAVFLITARPESLRHATEKNLRAIGCEWTGLAMKPARLKVSSEADFKTPARRQIAADGYTIILNVGDQQSDLTGGFAERTFKLPNPFYFTP